MADLSNQAVVVTGGTGALGTEVVRELCSLGAECHVPMLEQAAPAHLLAAGDRIQTYPEVDLTNEHSVRTFFAGLPELWGSVHATGGFSMASLLDTSLGEFEKMWRLNVVTAFLCCREAVRKMPAGGRIVNVGARVAVDPAPGMVAYVASKAGVVALTQAIAAETTGQGVYVNAVLPSIIDSAANRKAMPKADHDSWPTPAQLARTIGFLVSTENSLTSGAAIPVYGRA